MPGNPQKPKWAAATITKLAQNLARIVNRQWKPNISPFPTHSPYGQRRFFGLQWKEYGRNRGTKRKAGKISRREPGWVPFCGLSRGELILGVFEMPGTPQKPKWGAATTTKLQKLAQKKTVKTKHFSFLTHSHYGHNHQTSPPASPSEIWTLLPNPAPW